MKMNNKGFSLVELLLAVAVSTIVFGAITALIMYASNSSRQTNAKITLQNEAKDAVNHMESYVIEAQSAFWDDTKNALVLVKNSNDAKELADNKINTGNNLISTIAPYIKIFDSKKQTYVYWFDKGQKKLFFGECRTLASDQTNTVDLTEDNLPTGNMYLLADNVDDFSCSIKRNNESKKYVINFLAKFKDDVSEYNLNKCIYLRNQ